MALTDRASLKRALFRLVNTSATDDDLTEHDDSSLEGLYLVLQDGVDDAQNWLITHCGLDDVWTTTSSALSFSGSDPDRRASLPGDFLRFAGDERDSPLRYENGNGWGTLIRFKDRYRVRGNYYYLHGDYIYLARGASVPTDGVYMDYIYRIPTLADGTTVDMPVDYRDLIPAFAAVRALGEAWILGGEEMHKHLDGHLNRRKSAAYSKSRRSGRPRQAAPKPVLGDHWF